LTNLEKLFSEGYDKERVRDKELIWELYRQIGQLKYELDWFSRYVVSWELSDSLNVWFCCESLRRALTIGVPEIHNSDQGSHFTSLGYAGILRQYSSVRISMDHKGRCLDNIFVERLWRTIKYEEVYLKEYESLYEARESLHDYLMFYNTQRGHQALGYKTPEHIYFQKLTVYIS